jgi:hypothetical protein
MKDTTVFFVFIFALVCCIAQLDKPLLAGVVLKVESKDYEEDPPKVEESAISVEGRNLKMKVISDSSGALIYRGDRQEMILVSDEEQSYYIMNRETMQQMGAQVNQQMQEVNEAMKDLPKEQQEMIAKMMKEKGMGQPGAAAAPPAQSRSQVKKTADLQTINGYPCVKYEVFRDGSKIREHWVTAWDNVEGGNEIAGVFQEMAGFFQEMMQTFSSSSGMGDSPVQVDQSMFENLNELNGFPVASKDFAEDGSIENESVLNSADSQSIAPREFEPPANYKNRSMMGEK